MAGIIERCKTILAANVNDLLDKAEDANRDKIANQLLLDARNNLADVKKKTATVLANEESAAIKLQECKDLVAGYQNAAANALKSGNEADARACLEKKQMHEVNLKALQENYDMAHEDAETARQTFAKLASDISALEIEVDTLKQKSSTLQARKAAGKIPSMDKGSSARSRLDRMSEKVDKQLREQKAMDELDRQGTAGEDLLAKYGNGSPSSVDSELDALKESLGIQ